MGTAFVGGIRRVVGALALVGIGAGGWIVRGHIGMH